MKVLTVYDSKFGNTEIIAKAISEGMKEVGKSDVECKNGAAVLPEEMLEADVWVLGSPTHMWSASRNFKKLLKWVKKEAPADKRGVAFETRLDSAKGGAAKKIAKTLDKVGIEMIVEPASFAVTGNEGPLADGEEERAVTLGRRIAGELRG